MTARRKPGQARVELVEAAQEAFVELGYHGASLRHIAARADTTQAALYRYFPSKAALFEEAVFRPFETLLGELVANWRSSSDESLSTDDLIRDFTAQLYDFTAKNRGLMLALISADAHGDDSLGDVRSSFVETIGLVVAQVNADQHSRGWDDIDHEVAAPLTMAMIISSALLDGWLFPAGRKHPSKKRILTELTRYEIRAITGEQPSDD